MRHHIPLILFAKAPVEGKVKTRLMSKLTALQAAQVAEVLLEETIKLACNVWRGRVILAVWPNITHSFISQMSEKYDIDCVPQAEGDLGEKMYRAMEVHGYPCVVMGCDVPHCKPKTLQLAYQALERSGNVIGLAEDGGYYLLGLQSPCPALFRAIEWGGDSVSEATLAIAKQENVELQRLELLNDVDEYDDLVKVSSQIPALARLLRLDS